MGKNCKSNKVLCWEDVVNVFTGGGYSVVCNDFHGCVIKKKQKQSNKAG